MIDRGCSRLTRSYYGVLSSRVTSLEEEQGFFGRFAEMTEMVFNPSNFERCDMFDPTCIHRPQGTDLRTK